MPLTKSSSKQAFGRNIAAELKAGKPLKQAQAIAYSVKREAEHHTPNHSAHSQKRREHYEQVVATKIHRGSTQMTQARSQKLQNDEDWSE